MDFSKIEAEKLELERVGFSLRDQLEAATTVLAVRACRRNVEIIVDVPPDVPDNLMGDPGRLFQILEQRIGSVGVHIVCRVDDDHTIATVVRRQRQKPADTPNLLHCDYSFEAFGLLVCRSCQMQN